jgi:hypothetical protein
MIGYGNLEISQKRNSSKNLGLDFENLNLPKFSTPVIKKEKSSEVEMEMRRTYRIKPPLISNKFPSAFEIVKVDNKKQQHQNQLLHPLVKINENQNENKESSSSGSIKKRNIKSQSKKDFNLEPINLKTVKQKQIMKTKLSNELKLIDSGRKLEEDRENNFNQYNLKIQKNKKFILKPIEIRDPSRKNLNKENKNLYDKSSLSPRIRISLEVEKNFAKTSIVNFKLLENIDLKNLDKNEKYSFEISKIEKNLKMKPGEIMKMYKNLNENEDKIKMINSYYEKNNVKQSINKENSIKNLKLEEMITLGSINSSRTCGNIKKMLHVPSFKIYTVRVFIIFI